MINNIISLSPSISHMKKEDVKDALLEIYHNTENLLLCWRFFPACVTGHIQGCLELTMLGPCWWVPLKKKGRKSPPRQIILAYFIYCMNVPLSLMFFMPLHFLHHLEWLFVFHLTPGWLITPESWLGGRNDALITGGNIYSQQSKLSFMINGLI